jgi:predicted metal-dependent hydrolase
VSRKSEKIADWIKGHPGGKLDPHYLGYFELFNQGQFYEAHDVLEKLWLPSRGGPNGAFYKGLIQLAGAFVHLQKHTSWRPRLGPAMALLKLARANLERYPAVHEYLEISRVLALIATWLVRLESDTFSASPLGPEKLPRLQLLV